MDLTQNKLTKSEWTGIELPVDIKEQFILSIIKDGFADVTVHRNNNESIISIIKIENSPEIETFIYMTYLKEDLTIALNKYAKLAAPLHAAVAVQSVKSKKKPNSRDTIRLTNTAATILAKRDIMVEFAFIDHCIKALHAIYIKQDYTVHIYTLTQLLKTSIPHINIHVIHFVNTLISWTITEFPRLIPDMIHKAPAILESNPNIMKYADITLFDHQKQLFQLFGSSSNRRIPKLVLYIAPTGTGKTMSPLGLSETHRVIFVCTARHVGLALARSAISMEKRVAFAFGCESSADIRLHYFAAIDYTRNWKTGAIRKVDNSIGYKVEIMICDIKSYQTAMHYMLAFNAEPDIITFWDEPTITMDLENHDLHDTIHRNWSENLISKLVLSCATLPQEHEIQETISDFRGRFNSAEIHTIATHDCRKTITILNSAGYRTLPHTIFERYEDLQVCAHHCMQIKSLLRYLDLTEIVKFIEYVNKSGFIGERYSIATFFDTIDSITMDNIKLYYLKVLNKLGAEHWPTIYEYMRLNQTQMFAKPLPKSLPKPLPNPSVIQSAGGPVGGSAAPVAQVNPFSGILVTTEDAYTLTDGPTIYLAENIENLGKFYITQSQIPPRIFDEIMQKIEHNNRVQKKMDEIDKQIEDKSAKTSESVDEKFKGSVKRNSSSKSSDKGSVTKEIIDLTDQLTQLRSNICIANMDSQYIPNTHEHQSKWNRTGKLAENAFKPSIDDENIRDIMALDVPNQQKLLLLLGIGMFTNQPNIKYMEIMKSLATNQQLFLIIAASDYIYGTNYQFCHGFIGKDLQNMTQQKTIQGLGRIGRGNIQQTYTVRFRDNEIIRKLFWPVEVNVEGQIMSKLMNGASDWAVENVELIEKFQPATLADVSAAGATESGAIESCSGGKKIHPKYSKYTL